MKKINVLMLGVLILFSGFFASCKKDTANDATISLAGDNGYTATDATVTAGGTFSVKWTATSTIDMKYVSITKDDGALSAWTQVEIPSASASTYIGNATITVPASGGPYTYAIVIYDKDKVELARKQLVITIGAAAGNITTNAARTFGSGTNSSYFDVETNTVYSYNDVSGSTAVKNSIDFVYDSDKVWGTSTVTSTTGATFTDVSASITTAIFDAATTDALFSSLTNTATSVNAAADKVIAFTLKSGKKGLMKITAFTAGTNGSITFVTKVQQ